MGSRNSLRRIARMDGRQLQGTGQVDPAQKSLRFGHASRESQKAKRLVFQALNGKRSNAPRSSRHDFTNNGRAARVACNLSHTLASKIKTNCAVSGAVDSQNRVAESSTQS